MITGEESYTTLLMEEKAPRDQAIHHGMEGTHDAEPGGD
jgi:hypothetical protein